MCIRDREKYHPKKIVCDFIAGMTDNYAFRAYQEITLPKPITFIA
jgi:dGTP triphosphohydrolase